MPLRDTLSQIIKRNLYVHGRIFAQQVELGHQPHADNHAVTRKYVNDHAGFRNIIHNGDFRVNQRTFGGNWGATAAWTYGYDRWTTNGTSRVWQGIEPSDMRVNETYTLSWLGGGECSFYNGDDVKLAEGPSPLTFVLDVHPGTGTGFPYVFMDTGYLAYDIQLERGSQPTPFEVRPYQVELALCQRHYFEIQAYRYTSGPGFVYWDHDSAWFTIPAPVEMRRVPTITVTLAQWTMYPSDGIAYAPISVMSITVNPHGVVVRLEKTFPAGNSNRACYLGTSNTKVLLSADM